MNVGITLTFGAYGIIGGLYSELQKGSAFWSGTTVAIQVIGLLVVSVAAISCVVEAYTKGDDQQ